MRTRRFLLQPTTRQRASLERLVDAQRELYNAALEERRGAWRWERRSVSRYEQFGELTGWDHPVLAFGVVPARGTLTRLDRDAPSPPSTGAVGGGSDRGSPASRASTVSTRSS